MDAADLVVDSGGRRSPLPQWLVDAGGRTPPDEEVEDGLMYFGRFYKLEPGQSFPYHASPIADLGFLFALTFEADDGWFAIALAVHNEDRLLRRLREADAYEAALRAIPHTAVWRTEGLARPMTEVKTMSRIDDRWRDLVVDGSPLVTGLVAVGDSLVATNPALGRGSSLAWVCGRALVDVLAEHGDDPVSISLAQHHATHRLTRSWFEQTAQMDAERLATMRALLAGETLPEPDLSDPMAAIPVGLGVGANHDPELFRAMGKIAHVLAEPMDVVGDPVVFQACVDAFARRDELAGPPQPSRDDVLAAMATA